jgi:hypothetical protein
VSWLLQPNAEAAGQDRLQRPDTTSWSNRHATGIRQKSRRIPREFAAELNIDAS